LSSNNITLMTEVDDYTNLKQLFVITTTYYPLRTLTTQGEYTIQNFGTNTGRFIMLSVITNIYNKENQRTYLNGTVHSHRKTVFFFQLEIFDVCTTGDTAHIDTIFKLLPPPR